MEHSSAWPGDLRSVVLRPVSLFRELGEAMVAEHARRDRLSGQLGKSLALATLGALWRLAQAPPPESGDEALHSLIKSIQHEPQRLWALEDMAHRVSMGKTRLHRGFRRLTGVSPMAWVIQCRIDYAQLLLTTTPLKLASMAESCGYEDVYFFSRQFRQITGFSPGTWRRRMASANANGAQS
jgi:transcriptional regulator GlxA family with amidase domain